MLAWNWKQEFKTDYEGRTRYTLEGELVSAEVTHDPLTNVFALTYLDKFGEEVCPADADRGLAHVLRLVETALLTHLLDAAKAFAEPLGVEVESSPVRAVTPVDRTVGGYDAWLVVKEGRQKPVGDVVTLDGGNVCNIHPFIEVTGKLAESIGVPSGSLAAGVRWTDDKWTVVNRRLDADGWKRCGHSTAGQYWRSADGEHTVIVSRDGNVRQATHRDYEGE